MTCETIFFFSMVQGIYFTLLVNLISDIDFEIKSSFLIPSTRKTFSVDEMLLLLLNSLQLAVWGD